MIDNMGLVPMNAEITMFYTEFTSSLAFAAQQERDRIVQILQDLHPDDAVTRILIAIIKGEQE